MNKGFLYFAVFVICVAFFTGCDDADMKNGSVYYLNFKPEQDKAWQELAAVYTKKTGIPVTVVTAASKQYETMLMTEICKSDPPTLFQIDGPSGLKVWNEYCLDLSDTDVYKELIDDAYTLKTDDGAVRAIAYVIEAYGIIVNKPLLNKAGYSISDIKSFDDLKRITEDITARKEQLGFCAFTSSGMDGSSSWRYSTHLVNLPLYYEYKARNINSSEILNGTFFENFKNIFDLYVKNSTCLARELTAKTMDDARNEFLHNKAVFYQNGSWEYSNLIKPDAFKEDELEMIPIYFGVNDKQQGLCSGTENFWCINKEASPKNIQATMDFVKWCIESDEGTKAMADSMGFVIPFKKAKTSTNLFMMQDKKMTESGKTPVGWSFTTIPSPEWKKEITSALTMYAADSSTEKWELVKKAFVDNWESEYKLSNK